MKVNALYIVFFFCFTQLYYAQDDGVVAFDLPVRNSLKFNKYVINPTFSFVREQNKYISFTTKSEWVQFDNAPQTYLFNYSGRFRENIGAGLGLFQQNYGVFTTFGGVANFAYNAVLNRDNNLTFGINLGFYKSGINEGNVITNFSDPSLVNIPSNSLLTINPGINYGTAFFDFGLSINNLVSYNLTNSKIIEENPKQSIQAHIMYTGYVNSRGFFDESKFSTLFQSEFLRDQTVLSGLVMLTVPKGIWAQVGYNTFYGASAGIGLNITSQIALEYNYEKALGDFSTFGNSHEITIAYRFKNRYRYDYSGDDEEEAFVIPEKKKQRSITNRKSNNKTKKITPQPVDKQKVEEKQLTDEQAEEQLLAEEKIKLEEEAKLKAETEAKRIAEEKAKLEEAAKLKAETEAKRIAEEKARIEAEELAKAKLETEQARAAQELAKAKQQAEAEAKRIVDEKTRVEAEELAKAKLEEEEQARVIQEAAKVKQLAEEKAKFEETARLKAEAVAKRIAEEKARVETEELAKEKQLAEQKQAIEEKIKQEQLDAVLIPVAKDAKAKSMESIRKITDTATIAQQDLLRRLSDKIAIKQQDLDDLKEENDLGDQGIFTEPKPFKSVTAENAALELLKLEIDDIIDSQNLKIAELQTLYNERRKSFRKSDSTNVYYSRKIQELKLKQEQIKQSKANLLSNLEDIKVATEFEKRRRIKRAAYDNQEDRYLKDRTALNQIKQFTEETSTPLTEDDFDFGEEQNTNIQIVKDVPNTEEGYYLIIAVHSDVEKRDKFITQMVSSGRSDIDFFFDVNTSKYYIYYKKFNYVDRAKEAIDAKSNDAYNSKMSIIKIEN